MVGIKRVVVGIAGLLGAVALTAASAFGQTTVKYSFGSQGYLQYTYTYSEGQCGSMGQYQYQEWNYYGFAFFDGGGNEYPVAVGSQQPTVYMHSTAPPAQQMYCPPNVKETDIPLDVDGAPIVDVTPSSTLLVNVVSLPTPGYVNPKYVVVGLFYDPPGTSSSATYGNDTVVGSTTSTTKSLSTTTGSSVGTIFGFKGGSKYTSTYSSSYTQKASGTASVAVSQSSSVAFGISNGCQLGINHQCDQFRIWLNPLLNYGVVPNSSAADSFGYGIDLADQPAVGHMDVLQIQMGHLDGRTPMSAGERTELDRTWAPNNVDGSGPGLTQTDFSNIVDTNPFSNSSYTLQFSSPGAQTTTDGRFTATSGPNMCGVSTIPYDIDTSYQCNVSYTTTGSSNENASSSYTQGYAVESEFSTSVFGITFGSDVKNSTSITSTQSFDQGTNQSNGQTADVTVIGFPQGTSYSGPVEFTLWQDNLYGTFMFYPVN